MGAKTGGDDPGRSRGREEGREGKKENRELVRKCGLKRCGLKDKSTKPHFLLRKVTLCIHKVRNWQQRSLLQQNEAHIA